MDKPNFKIFGRWDSSGIKVKDPGLAPYINLSPVLIPKSRGRHAKTQFHKSKMHIVERLITRLMVPGHRGKKHVISSGRCTGHYLKKCKIVMKAFEIIEKKTGKNPIEVLVRAIENAAIREEIASYQVGGIIVRRAVVTSPQRRVDLALRLMVQAAYRKAHNTKLTMAEALAQEIIGAYENNPAKSEAIREKERIEREAEAAR